MLHSGRPMASLQARSHSYWARTAHQASHGVASARQPCTGPQDGFRLEGAGASGHASLQRQVPGSQDEGSGGWDCRWESGLLDLWSQRGHIVRVT